MPTPEIHTSVLIVREIQNTRSEKKKEKKSEKCGWCIPLLNRVYSEIS